MDNAFLLPLVKSLQTDHKYTLAAAYSSYHMFMVENISKGYVETELHNRIGTVKYFTAKDMNVSNVNTDTLHFLYSEYPLLPRELKTNSAGSAIARRYMDALMNVLDNHRKYIHTGRVFSRKDWFVGKRDLTPYGKELLVKLDGYVSYNKPSISLSNDERAFLTALEKKPIILTKKNVGKAVAKVTGKDKNSNEVSSLYNPLLNRGKMYKELIDYENTTRKNFWKRPFTAENKWSQGIPWSGLFAFSTSTTFVNPTAGLVLTGITALLTSGVMLRRDSRKQNILRLTPQGEQLLQETRAWEKYERETSLNNAEYSVVEEKPKKNEKSKDLSFNPYDVNNYKYHENSLHKNVHRKKRNKEIEYEEYAYEEAMMQQLNLMQQLDYEIQRSHQFQLRLMEMELKEFEATKLLEEEQLTFADLAERKKAKGEETDQDEYCSHHSCDHPYNEPW